MPATCQPRSEAEILQIISLSYMAQRTGESTVDDSHG